ncbi:MAG: hypothetical protein DI556_01930 [Rhodovulum sulfidophilum]|uniref:Uncharacterized protein n=1 Tax=Rhodovulum sulfidophilum TaxID=35806 RepID=A0A2W5NIV2_RHOSU|nr:MAG: hypothetical protein DI556_01930 [Rhodovulum sulfidophilum]
MTGPWRGEAKASAPEEVFVPGWKSPPPGDELRAPKLRKGGLAVIDAPAEPVPEPEARAPEPEITPPFPAAPGVDRPAELPAEAALPPVKALLATPDSATGREALPPGLAAWTGPAAPPERSRRSVLLACLIGAAIAALIVALAFAFRPAIQAGAPAPAETPAATE